MCSDLFLMVTLSTMNSKSFDISFPQLSFQMHLDLCSDQPIIKLRVNHSHHLPDRAYSRVSIPWTSESIRIPGEETAARGLPPASTVQQAIFDNSTLDLTSYVRPPQNPSALFINSLHKLRMGQLYVNGTPHSR